jgi:hypothetical protein
MSSTLILVVLCFASDIVFSFSLLANKKKLLMFVLLLVSEGLDIYSLHFGSLIVKSPLDIAIIIINPIIINLYNRSFKESVINWQNCLAIIGSLLIFMSGVDKIDQVELLSDWTNPIKIVIFVLIGVAFSVYSLFVYSHTPNRSIHLVMISTMLSSFSSLLVNRALILSSQFEEINVVETVFCFLIGLVCLITSWVTLGFANEYKGRLLLYTVGSLIVKSSLGLLLNDDSQYFHSMDWLLFFIGIFTCMIALLLFS